MAGPQRSSGPAICKANTQVYQMPALFLKDSNQFLAELSDADLAHMVNLMEEESSKDTDYFIDLATVDILEEAGASAAMVEMLRGAVGDSDGIDIAWEST